MLPLPDKNSLTYMQYFYQLIYYQIKNTDIKTPLPSSVIMYKLLKILNDENSIPIPIKVKSRSKKDQLMQSQASFSKIISKSISGVNVDLSSKDKLDFIIPMDNYLLKLLQNTDKDRKTQMLCLDLDETLIHSALEPKVSSDHEFLLYDEEHRQYFFVFKRPFVDLFLTTLAHFYDISVFTASYSCYSGPIMEFIDPYELITKKYYNTSLTATNIGLEKDLRVVSETHVPHKIIMVDNSITACITHRENLYVINSYKAEKNNDIELLSLIPLLLALSPSNISDTRAILHRRSRNNEKIASSKSNDNTPSKNDNSNNNNNKNNNSSNTTKNVKEKVRVKI
jgi:RNA polymerase II subunit A small phosphatase-like protein